MHPKQLGRKELFSLEGERSLPQSSWSFWNYKQTWLFLLIPCLKSLTLAFPCSLTHYSWPPQGRGRGERGAETKQECPGFAALEPFPHKHPVNRLHGHLGGWGLWPGLSSLQAQFCSLIPLLGTAHFSIWVSECMGATSCLLSKTTSAKRKSKALKREPRGVCVCGGWVQGEEEGSALWLRGFLHRKGELLMGVEALVDSQKNQKSGLQLWSLWSPQPAFGKYF